MKEIDRMLKVLNKPAIKTIKMRPSAYPKGVEVETNVKKIHQPWHLNGRCPEGTIPIHRTRKSDLMRAISLKNFGKKYPEGIRHPEIVDGDHVSDDYRKTGCYNLKCSGFVQVSTEYLLGGTISPVSEYGGHQFRLAVNIFQDVENGNWWLQLQNNLIGYWPGSLDPGFAGGAEFVLYGGEIVDIGVARGIKGPHTTTEMGSGHFSGEGEGKAGAFSKLQVIDKDQSGYKSPQDVTTFVKEPYCYDLSLMKTTSNWGVYFFYGGPGRNQNCP
ncbi:hypothetical protein QJS10_CPA07g00937 [Acorus calamus]|uniref:Neprosin PEP catalytic domain-containing protein n=1 Tax=Acorus calamus TaxID=4465 RepID=A0AAV9EH04_ACOCL|nr:hypothetical protein QJS10_CPA07g00937 [Acorus calamus]